MSANEPLVTELSDCATRVMGKPPASPGLKAVRHVRLPHRLPHAGRSVGRAQQQHHAADEYVEIDSLVEAAKVLLVFVHQWCSAR